MKPDLKTDLKAIAGSIKPRAEFLEQGQEHLRIQTHACRQTNKGPFEPSYTPKQCKSFVFPYRLVLSSAFVFAFVCIGSQLPTVQHALHESKYPFLQETGDFLEKHGFPLPFVDSTNDIHERGASVTATSSDAYKSESKSNNKAKKFYGEAESDTEIATGSQPAAAAAGVRPSMIETLKRVITLPELPNLPDAVNGNNGKKPTTTPATNPEDLTLPEKANEKALDNQDKKTSKDE